MKIGFDIDDTLINLREHAFELYKRKLNMEVPSNNFYELQTVEIHELFGLTSEEGSKMWKESLEEIYYTNCPPYEDIIEILQTISKEGHEIYYITARPKEHGERTKEWLRDLGFPIEDDRFFYGMKDEEKVSIIKDLQLDFYFDDKPEVVNTLVNESVTTVLRDQSYNRHLNFPRIKTWSQLLELLES
ncbi:HAD hydrolase-like protein [Bacillus sp. BGMRC 2118]|nr:HAD hydrolase-like protein [Bacillus sp. BGMRC 2118]